MLIASIIAIVLGYLIGSISPAYILGKLMRGIDIREYGTKNAGATNAFRVLGKTAGIITLVFDLGKSVLAMFIAYLLLFGNKFDINVFIGMPFAIMCLAGFAAILGHDFPFYMQFRGGKGAASAWGAFLTLIVLFILKGNSLGVPWVAGAPLFILIFFALSIIIITKSAHLAIFISFPLSVIGLLMLRTDAISIAISLFFLYITIISVTEIIRKKGLRNDMKFAEKKQEIKIWRKALRFIFLIFPVVYFWLDKNIILIALGVIILIFTIFDFTKIKQNKIIKALYKEAEVKMKFSGITLFLIGAFITTLFFHRDIAILAMVFAAVGDNFAVLFGIPFGRRKIFREKSIEGTIACLATSFIVGLIFMPFLNVNFILVIFGALAATIAELFSGIYDNITMAPLAALIITLANKFL